MKSETATARAVQEMAILDVMTENARRRTGRFNGLRQGLVIIAAILFFPAVLPVYFIWWLFVGRRQNR